MGWCIREHGANLSFEIRKKLQKIRVISQNNPEKIDIGKESVGANSNPNSPLHDDFGGGLVSMKELEKKKLENCGFCRAALAHICKEEEAQQLPAVLQDG